MSEQNDGGPAFPSEQGEQEGNWNEYFGKCMSLREYAAIELCVPDSGTDWLDDMIRQSQRDRFAGMAFPVVASILDYTCREEIMNLEINMASAFIASMTYDIADAMLADPLPEPEFPKPFRRFNVTHKNGDRGTGAYNHRGVSYPYLICWSHRTSHNSYNSFYVEDCTIDWIDEESND